MVGNTGWASLEKARLDHGLPDQFRRRVSLRDGLVRERVAEANRAQQLQFARDSGTRSRQRHIQGGRARVRCSLYMAALSAICHAPELQVKYQRLVNAGKPGKVAMVAVMRNLIALANHLLAEDRTWSPEPPRKAACAS